MKEKHIIQTWDNVVKGGRKQYLPKKVRNCKRCIWSTCKSTLDAILDANIHGLKSLKLNNFTGLWTLKCLTDQSPLSIAPTHTCSDRENTCSLIWVNEGHSDITSKPCLITLLLFCIWPLNKPRSYLLLFRAKNCKTTNRKGKDLISRFVVTALKLIFRCRPSRIGEVDQVKLNIPLIYLAHRPLLMFQRLYEWPMWACAVL